jgi:exosortase/archaeosortase family protein
MTLVTLAVVYAYFTKPKSDRDDDMKSDDGRTGRAPHAGRPRGDAARPRSQPKIGLFLKNFTFWRSLLLVLASVPIAILTNAVRVSGTGVLAHYYGTRVADGFFHTFSGWVIYIAAAVLLFATGWALDRFARLGKRSRTKTAVWQRVREADA